MSHTNDIDNLITKKLHEAVTWNFKVLQHPAFVKEAVKRWGSSVNLKYRAALSQAKSGLKPGDEIFVIFQEHDYSSRAAPTNNSWNADRAEWQWNEQNRFKEKKSTQDFLFYKFQAVGQDELKRLGFRVMLGGKFVSTLPTVKIEQTKTDIGDAEMRTKVVAYIKETSNV